MVAEEGRELSMRLFPPRHDPIGKVVPWPEGHPEDLFQGLTHALGSFATGGYNGKGIAVGDVDGDNRLEIVVVTGVRIGDGLVLETSQVAQSGADNSDLLRLFPGGNRNANGPLSRISQYRGLFGAQNEVTVDGIGYTADCPNWMDTPLSSIPQSLTQSVTLYRGIGSVATVPEGLGGGIAIAARRGEFADGDGWSTYGQAEAGYGSSASSRSGAVFAGLHDRNNRIDVAASSDRADDYEFDGGVVRATEYERAQYRFGYGHRFDDTGSSPELHLGAVANRTGPSGTRRPDRDGNPSASRSRASRLWSAADPEGTPRRFFPVSPLCSSPSSPR